MIMPDSGMVNRRALLATTPGAAAVMVTAGLAPAAAQPLPSIAPVTAPATTAISVASPEEMQWGWRRRMSRRCRMWRRRRYDW
ncbi:hypothetical protein [Phreatobacter sp.]|uniref:hypothetical protein n=1 Tax=Phreatobacter sp. TaxID=1966341 RepID=UPI0025D73296|nr:hypothetical protein [Phreatobacter sp.]